MVNNYTILQLIMLNLCIIVDKYQLLCIIIEYIWYQKQISQEGQCYV